MTERTLVLVKPDGVQRLLVGRILGRFEERGLKIVGLKLVHVDRDLAERHYAIHREKPFFGGLVDFITSSPLVAVALDGPNAIAVVPAGPVGLNCSRQDLAQISGTNEARLVPERACGFSKRPLSGV